MNSGQRKANASKSHIMSDKKGQPEEESRRLESHETHAGRIWSVISLRRQTKRKQHAASTLYRVNRDRTASTSVLMRPRLPNEHVNSVARPVPESPFRCGLVSLERQRRLREGILFSKQRGVSRRMAAWEAMSRLRAPRCLLTARRGVVACKERKEQSLPLSPTTSTCLEEKQKV